MNKIICLVGASGSGKTTIAKELDKLGYNIIHSYTTREPRGPNEWGHTFVNEVPMKRILNRGVEGTQDGHIIDKDEMIAFKEVYEGLYYWATKEQYRGKGTSIYVVDPDGANQVKKNVKDAEVIIIFIQCDKHYRTYRMFDDPSRDSATISERLSKDEVIFKIVKCDYVVNGNKQVEQVLENVLEIIERG